VLSYAERTSRIAADAAEVPATFGLRGFRGDVFRVNLASSYVNDAGTVVLYTDAWSRVGWASFAKGPLVELRTQVSTPQLREVAETLHRKCPGTWVNTDQGTTVVLELRPDDAPHPSDGNGMWWRTHHLVRQLGGQA
jgi:hypothetical protein